MAIAAIGRRAVDKHRYAGWLDEAAEHVRAEAGDSAPVEALIGAIDDELFSNLGFRGNSADYSDPENSYLDRVIDRRTGIPITLSLVYMEIAQRVGLRCDGVGYPGHFIVRCGDPEAPIYLDPFHQGDRLDRTELLARLRAVNIGGPSAEAMLAAVTRRQILQRMLTNLRRSYRQLADYDRWLLAIHLQLRIEPWNAALLGERGMLNYRLGNVQQAEEDLERFVGADAARARDSGATRLLNRIRSQSKSREQ
jgi:regulator of sirC expression with transglutaminase-like and TPR domain